MKRTAFLAIVLLVCLGASVSAQPAEPDFKEILDNHGSILLLIEQESGAIRYANQAAVNFYGYSKEQLEALKITEINTLSAAETAGEMQAAVSEQRNFFRFVHRLATGEMRNVEVYSYPYLENGKQMLFSIINDVTPETQLAARNKAITTAFFVALAVIVLFLLAFSIITFRMYRLVKKQRDEIINFNELRQTFIDADDSLIYLKDENLKYLFVNRAVEEFYGKKSNEIIGQDDYALSEAAFAEQRRQTDCAVLERLSLVGAEIRWQDKIFKATKFPVKLLDGEYGVGAYIKDVTAEEQTKRTIEKSLQRNAILVNVLNKSYSSTQEQLDDVLNETLHLTESEFGYIYLYDEQKKEFSLNSWSKTVMPACSVMEKQTVYQLEKTGIWGEVVRQGEPIIVNDFTQPNPLKKGYPAGHVPITKFMSIPVIIDQKIVAVVGLANKKEDYDENDLNQVTALMQGAWHAKERREILVTLAMEREKYLLTLLSIGDGVMVVDKNGRIEMLNAVAERITEWTTAEARGRHYKEVFVLSHQQQGIAITDPIAAVFATNEVQQLGNNAVLTAKSGTKYFIEDSAAPIKDEHHNTWGVVLVFRDVTEKKAQRQKIEYLSFHDALTGLYNRRYFEEELIRADRKNNLPLSIIMADVNGLKLANDIFGHTYGDLLLQKVAKTLRQACRSNDIIARWGGDEFIILLPKTTLAEAEKISLRIKNQLAQEEVRGIKGSMSMGCAAKNNVSEKLIEVLELAEDQMYTEKTLSRTSTNTTLLENIMQALYGQIPQEEAHARRVSKLSEEIGREMGLAAEELKRLSEAAFYHDIGKISLSEILLSKNELQEQEWNELKQHPVVGYRILSAFDDTIDLAQYVLAHHEKLDGSGYPKGLKGREIPKLARIIAVAESYDAMTHDLAYRPARGKSYAIKELQNSAGTQFDPLVVASLLRVLKI
jgi:diguanylate cyclase (GGDEF)-like protein/PAS domain S-box-containing protein